MVATDTNPYATPVLTDTPTTNLDAEAASAHSRRKAYLAWPVVLALNMIVPIIYGSMLATGFGQFGMGAGIAMFLLAGWGLCRARTTFAWKAMAGALLLAPTQFVPILQMVAGLAALALAHLVGLPAVTAEHPEVAMPSLHNPFSAMFVTLVTGTILLSMAVVAGQVLARLLPDWFTAPSKRQR